ncbi:MAG: hypothetical protein PHH83_02280 [Patescibacteria group bacterium]|nr:hypothetical protein [Patescibacteria group bacterium]
MKKNIIKFFILCTIVIVLFSGILFLSFKNRQNVFAIGGDDMAGWFWSPLLGWVSQGCNNRYYDAYQNFCGMPTKKPFLDVNFDGSDFLTNTTKVKDSSENALLGEYQIFNGSSFVGKMITLENVKNGKSNSNYDSSFYGFDNSAIEFDNENFMVKEDDKDFSISLWFKINTTKIADDEKAFLFSNGEFDDDRNLRYYCYLYHDSSRQDRIVCGLGDTEINEEIDIEAGSWHNLTFVSSDTGQIKLYVNYTGNAEDCSSTNETGCGVSDGLLGVNSLNSTLSDPIDINKRLILANMISRNSFDNYTMGFPGLIDEFRFFETGLMASEVKINTHHNSNYGLNMDSDGSLSGWSWSSHYGWICFGSTCDNGYGTQPNPRETKVNFLSSPSQGIFQYMITGWAKIIGLNKVNSDVGWISLNSNTEISPGAGDITYLECSSCSVKDVETGLISYWKMDEQSGDVISDYSGFDNRGNLFSNNENFSYPNGVVNNCIYLDGDDYIQSTGAYKIDKESFSVQLWINPLESNGEESILYTNSELNFNVTIKDNKKITLNFEKQSESIDYSFTDNWYQISVIVRNGSLISLYINKDLIMEFKIDKYKDLILENLIIGSDGDYKNNFFGYVDMFRLYQKVLSEDEIIYNYYYPEKRLCSACFYVQNALDKINICYDCGECYLDGTETNCKSCAECRRYGLVFDTNTSNIKGFAWSGPDPNGYTTERGLGWVKFSPTLSAGLYKSYISAQYGNIYSRSNIGTEYTIVPPVGQYNATYLIQANGNITNWISEQMVVKNEQNKIIGFDYSSKWLNQNVNYNFPSQNNNYGNVLGSLDYDGIVGGEYGTIEHTMPEPGYLCLDNKIYKPDGKFFKDGKFTIEAQEDMDDAYIFWEKSGCDNASGIFVIDGDLVINGNIRYYSNVINNVKELSSVVWIIKGDLYIDPSVTGLAGTFIVLGAVDHNGNDIQCGDNVNDPEPKCGIIYTGASNKQLIVSGQFLAKNFQFQRTYKSDFREPSELIIYDGRNIINPPQGLGDVIKSLPRWDQITPY